MSDKKSCKDIRREFVAFFQERGHAFVPSSSLLPAEDPTLLFTNAGMNQFKDIFLGRETRAYNRAANSQKCIRAGGKHNDLEDVGHDTYHHTFFEMLGNWSFGDYFKAEAIQWAWELLTGVWGLAPERLHATYFGGDESEGLAADSEARDLWARYLPPQRIHPGSKKDNFWEMGDTGPCGPCSEIHYDFTPDLSGGPLVNKGDARVIEIWNLVFMQFNRGGDGKLAPLPAKHVDTGMGFERVCRVLQGVSSNYDIDVFRGLFAAIHKVGASAPYGGTMDDIKDIAYRVIADHARALTFAIADGIMPSNEGRGYVLRRILRRAARYGRQYLNLSGPFITQLVPTVVELMGESYPEIAQRQKAVQQTIRAEEESFGKTLDRGIELFDRQVEKLKPVAKTIPGDVVFELYATYGFPVDLTQVMAAEQGMAVDLAGYEAEMAKHREISGAGDKFAVAAIANLPATDDKAKYSHVPLRANVLGWVVGSEFQTGDVLTEGAEAAIVLDQTNFYGEQGGQVGDSGVLTFDVAQPPSAERGEFKVNNSVLAGQCVLHFGVVVKGQIKVGTAVTAKVDSARIDTMRNHTATHLLNWALREVLGDHVNQAGSIVAPDRLRFDFSHTQAMTAEELARVETMVNEQILRDLAVATATMPLAEGKKVAGVRAVFGEKYPDPVRVVMVQERDSGFGTRDSGKSKEESAPETRNPKPAIPVSAEFCGGTHLDRTGQVGLFKIVGEESIAKGVRRITALTGKAAVEHIQRQDALLAATSQVLRCRPEELPDRLAAMQKEIKELKKRPAGGGGGDEMKIVATAETPAGKILVAQAATPEQDALRTFCDVQRQKGFVAIFVGGAGEDKVTLVAMVDDALAKSGKLKAGDWVKAVAPVVDGGGGGKPTLAQAGGKKPEKLSDALQEALKYVEEKLK